MSDRLSIGEDVAPSLEIGSQWLIVQPGFEARAPGGRVLVTVPRGAFGSGEHETTRNCLEVLADLGELEGMTVLDVGSGTGILAVAALLRGAAHALSFDIELSAGATSRRSARLNGLADENPVFVGTLDALHPRQHDLVVANLYGDVLLEIGVRLCRFLAPTGRLLLSGIAWEYAFQVRQLFLDQGLVKLRECWLEEFVTMLFCGTNRDSDDG